MHKQTELDNDMIEKKKIKKVSIIITQFYLLLSVKCRFIQIKSCPTSSNMYYFLDNRQMNSLRGLIKKKKRKEIVVVNYIMVNKMDTE